MSRETAAIRQEIIDQGLEIDLGHLGRGVLGLGTIENTLHPDGPYNFSATDVVLDFISSKEIPDGDGDLAEAFICDGPKRTSNILKALKSSSVRGAVDTILRFGSERQREYMMGTLELYRLDIENGYDNPHSHEHNGEKSIAAEPEDIKTGLWRNIVLATMIGSPELGALSIAKRWTKLDSQHRGSERSESNLPKIRGYHSYIFPPKEKSVTVDEDPASSNLIENEYGTVGYAFPELSETYQQVRSRIFRRDPDCSEEELEHRSVIALAKIIAKSTEYNDRSRGEESPYRSGFAEQMAWAQLGDQVQRQFRGMRQKIMGVDMHNIGRFIGKSGDNPYEQDWRKIEEFASVVSPDNVSPAREYLITRVNVHTRSRHRLRGNDEAGATITEGATGIIEINNLTDDEVLARFHEMRGVLESRRNSHMSLAQKALYLHFQDEPQGASPIDWINTASFGMINRTYRALTRGVSKETAFAYAVAEQIFPGESITRETVNACRGVTTASLNRAQSLGQLYEERGLSLSPQDRLKLGVISTRYDAKDVADLVLQGYDVNAIMEFPWLCHLETDKPVAFPANGNEAQKQRWCAENGYAYLNGGWSKTSLGKIILTRLESGVESSIHDASQWLETFQIPEEGYDIQLLKARLRDDEPLGDDVFEKTRFFDTNLEASLLAGILQAPQELRVRLLLPRKTQKIQQIFYAPEHQLLYFVLADIYRDDTVDTGRLHDLALEKLDTFYDEWLVNAHGKETTYRISKEDFRVKVLQAIAQINESTLPEGSSITGAIQQLSRYGESRKGYINDATSWLSRHMTSPSARLTRVWGDRASALMEGIGDSAREIESWQADNALRSRLDELTRQYAMPHNLTAEEVMNEFSGWAHELSRCYSSDRVVTAISEYKSNRTTEALLPAQTLEIQTPDGAYRAEVLAKDDPRGATIGIDTGCCMTLDGASASCIKSGYRDKNAGFFALYTPQGRLAAQSYFYVNPDHPRVLVLDNIEANQGRDTDRIVSLYKDALTQYLVGRFAEDSEWEIETVQVGTGYGDAVKSSVLRLPGAQTIPNNLGYVYTDADQQRLLLQLSEEQIAKSRQDKLHKQSTPNNVPNHLPDIVTQTITADHSTIIRELEKQIYPEHMRQYRDRAMLEDELHMNGMNQFSFLIVGETDSSKDYLGYCMAYFEQSETDPGRKEPVIYVADLAILPDFQGAKLGAKIFDELLRRTSERGINRVEMHTRETTSYAALKNSDWVKRILYERGYKFIDHGAVDEFVDDNGSVENLYLVSLDRI